MCISKVQVLSIYCDACQTYEGVKTRALIWKGVQVADNDTLCYLFLF